MEERLRQLAARAVALEAEVRRLREEAYRWQGRFMGLAVGVAWAAFLVLALAMPRLIDWARQGWELWVNLGLTERGFASVAILAFLWWLLRASYKRSVA